MMKIFGPVFVLLCYASSAAPQGKDESSVEGGAASLFGDPLPDVFSKSLEDAAKLLQSRMSELAGSPMSFHNAAKSFQGLLGLDEVSRDVEALPGFDFDQLNTFGKLPGLSKPSGFKNEQGLRSSLSDGAASVLAGINAAKAASGTHAPKTLKQKATESGSEPQSPVQTTAQEFADVANTDGTSEARRLQFNQGRIPLVPQIPDTVFPLSANWPVFPPPPGNWKEVANGNPLSDLQLPKVNIPQGQFPKVSIPQGQVPKVTIPQLENLESEEHFGKMTRSAKGAMKPLKDELAEHA